MLKTWLNLLIVALLLAGLCLSCSDDGESKPPADAAAVDQQQADLSSSPDAASPDSASPDQATPDVGVDSLMPDYGALPNCPIETNLTSHVPCLCYTVVATAADVQACTSTLKCCPLAKKPVCE